MAKKLKLQIKNVQIADAINLRGLKAKLSKKKEGDEQPESATSISDEAAREEARTAVEAEKKKRPQAKAETKGEVPVETARASTVEAKAEVKEPAKAETQAERPQAVEPPPPAVKPTPIVAEQKPVDKEAPKVAPKAEFAKTDAVRPRATTGTVTGAATGGVTPTPRPMSSQAPAPEKRPSQPPPLPPPKPVVPEHLRLGPVMRTVPTVPPKPVTPPAASKPPGQWREVAPPRYGPRPPQQGYERRGPPGERGSYPPREGGPPREPRPPYQGQGGYGPPRTGGHGEHRRPPLGRTPPPPSPKPEARTSFPEKKEFTNKEIEEGLFRRSSNKMKPKEPPAKPLRKVDSKELDSRIRHGLRGDVEEEGWKRRRPTKQSRQLQEQEIVRPTKISIRLPISVKDLSAEMKLKASQLISKLFLQGQILTMNDLLDEETAVQLLGHEFGCEIIVDTKEEERIRITDKSVQDEIKASDSEELVIRPPVVAFMGHVDHGKTSLIDAIRATNTAEHEVGAITQHIGAFRVSTPQGDIAILDTPGHEAFSNMRERGAEVTDIVVLVVAGDEGMKEQTEEALKQAKASKATIVVAINKCDKPAFDADKVYRQLADHELLPESWGGQTITVNCSAVTRQGIPELLEMLALQSEILELRANPHVRARGTVIESEIERGLGPVATVLVQNGTLRMGDSLVFGYHWAKVKTMKDEKGRDLVEAGPSTPVRINGLSGLPESGEEFIVVKSDREARDISQVRQEGRRHTSFQTKKRGSVESMMEQAQEGVPKKSLTLILRADVQGSVEALKNALEKILSKKVEINIISTGVGQISESDVQLAFASKATILGFHTPLESHVESTIKELGVQVRLHDIIYHAVDDVRALMLALLDKITQEKDVGKAEVKAVFKSSQLGLIAGCQVLDGSITRNNQIRVMREGKQIWKGPISSLKRHKDDVREVTKGAECGILLQGFSEVLQGDILEAFEVIYLSQEL